MLVRSDLKKGWNELVKKGDMEFLRFGVLILEKDEEEVVELLDEEMGLVLLSGKVIIKTDGETFETGYRKDVFSSEAWGFYCPPRRRVTLKAVFDSEIAIAFAPSKIDAEPVLVKPEDVRIRRVGVWNWRRDVKDIIDDRIKAEKLLLGETVNPPGNWSSWPPHKHDVDDPPNEYKMEEVYFFKVNPRTGFGIQRVYNHEDLDEVYVVRENDTVLIKKGYHPVAAAPGSQVYYLWILAGESRILSPHDDPDWAWQKLEEPLLREIIR